MIAHPARVEQLLASIARRADDSVVIWRDHAFSGTALLARVRAWSRRLADEGAAPGDVVGLQARFSVEAIAVLLAILQRRCVAAMVPAGVPDAQPYLRDASVATLVRVDGDGRAVCERPGFGTPHPLLARLREQGDAGLVVFTSGSTAAPKAALHGATAFLSKFDRERGKALRTLAFLLLDHIAGLDTLFYTLSYGGVLVIPERLDPASVCRTVERHRVEVLPASPTFLNLLLVGEADRGRDLTCLRIVTYGSEPMGQATLARLHERLPGVRLVQKYGTTEFGAPRARSRSSGCLWLRLKADEVEARVVDGVLWIRSPAAMLGYLNAPSPFDDDGWICTGDLVQQDGEWIRVLGRGSDLINVGGEKVSPVEVEEAILELEGVADVLVCGEANPITGQIVVARVQPRGAADEAALRRAVRGHCRRRLAPYKVPARVVLEAGPLATDRQKKGRTLPHAS